MPSYSFLNSKFHDKLDFYFLFLFVVIIPVVILLLRIKFNFILSQVTEASKNYISIINLYLFFSGLIFLISKNLFLLNFFGPIWSLLIVFFIINCIYVDKFKIPTSDLVNLSIFLINILIYSPLLTFEENYGHNFLVRLFNSENYIIYLLLALFFYLVLTLLLTIKINKHFLLFIIPIILYLSFDLDFHSINLHHYIPFIGPSVHSIYGGTYGVEIFPPYGFGLSFLTEIYFKFMPINFYSFGFLVRIINFITYIILLLLILKLTKHKLVSLIFTLSIILIHQNLMGTNYNAFPSTFGVRYLLPLLLILSLSFRDFEIKKSISYFTYFIFLVMNLWSFENLIYSYVIIIGHIFIYGLINKNFSFIVYSLRKIFLLVLSLHILINLYLLFFDKSFFRYDIFLEFTFKNISQTKAAQIQNFLIWIPFLVIYSFVIIRVLLISLNKYFMKNNIRSHKNFIVLTDNYNLAALGVIITLYYVGRSVPLALYFVFFPLSILIYKYFENNILFFLKKKKYFLFIIILFFSIILSGTIQRDNIVKHSNHIQLLNYMKSCDESMFSCLKKYTTKDLYLFHSTYFDIHGDDQDFNKKVFNQAEFLFDKYDLDDDKRDLIFISIDHMPNSEILMMKKETWYFHPISWIFSDTLSEKLTMNIIKKNNLLEPGQKIIYLNDYKKLHHFEKKVFLSISNQNWNICLIEKLEHVSLGSLSKKC